jgi:hypothetical protein
MRGGWRVVERRLPVDGRDHIAAGIFGRFFDISGRRRYITLMRALSLSGIFLSLALLAAPPRARAQEDYTGSRSRGMGGAHRAIVTGNDAIFLNPAGMSLLRRYSIEPGYLFNAERETHVASISIVDSITASVAAGLSYSYVNGLRTVYVPSLTGDAVPQRVDRTGNIIHLALSVPMGRNLTVGIGGKYMNLSYGGRSAVNAVTVDVGLLYRVSPMVALSLSGYGLTNTGSAEAPLAMAVGFAVGPPTKFQFALDWVIDFTTSKYLEDLPPSQRARATRHEIHSGIEWQVFQGFALRAGYFHDRVTRVSPDNAFTFGLGYFSAKARVGVNAVFEQRFLNTDDRQLLIALNLLL